MFNPTKPPFRDPIQFDVPAIGLLESLHDLSSSPSIYIYIFKLLHLPGLISDLRIRAFPTWSFTCPARSRSDSRPAEWSR